MLLIDPVIAARMLSIASAGSLSLGLLHE